MWASELQIFDFYKRGTQKKVSTFLYFNFLLFLNYFYFKFDFTIELSIIACIFNFIAPEQSKTYSYKDESKI